MSCFEFAGSSSSSPLSPPSGPEVAPTPRKRTSSFYLGPSAMESTKAIATTCSSQPRPAKAPRLGTSPLPRNESSCALSDLFNPSTTSSSPSGIPHTRSMKHYKEQRDRERRRVALLRSGESSSTLSQQLIPHDPFSASPDSTTSTSTRNGTSLTSPPVSSWARPPRCSSSLVASGFRTSSPLAPMRSILPARPSFPRSKQEPDLYRQAIRTCMQGSTEGKKVLHMGPRLALSIAAATKELERIVFAQQEREVQQQQALLLSIDTPMDLDVDFEPLAPPSIHSGPIVHTHTLLSNSWVVIPGEDWEMVDCAA